VVIAGAVHFVGLTSRGGGGQAYFFWHPSYAKVKWLTIQAPTAEQVSYQRNASKHLWAWF